LPQSPRPPLSPSPLKVPKLYPIVDADLCGVAGRAPADVARAFLSAGATWLQLRCKTMGSGAFLDLANIVLQDARAAAATVIVNDRADVARASGAPGLHVGQDDLTPADARVVVGASCLLGLSTHTLAQWQAAVREPISYLAIGPAFGTGTKNTGYEPVGLGVVSTAAALAAEHGLPVVAIGGITIENARAVIDAGASSVAVISDLLKGDPERRCREFIRALE
jgi:thiamine-phosphate pyrophosphorylase